MKRSRSAVMVGVLGLVVLAVGLSGVAQAKPKDAKFVVLGNGEVLDVRTSLRWQQAPGSANVVGDGASCNGGASCVWQEAVDYCAALEGGYRLPEVKELISLVDYSQFNFALPAGHPFTGVQSSLYWSATSDVTNLSFAWNVNVVNGFVFTINKAGDRFVWCVR